MKPWGWTENQTARDYTQLQTGDFVVVVVVFQRSFNQCPCFCVSLQYQMSRVSIWTFMCIYYPKKLFSQFETRVEQTHLLMPYTQTCDPSFTGRKQYYLMRRLYSFSPHLFIFYFSSQRKAWTIRRDFSSWGIVPFFVSKLFSAAFHRELKMKWSLFVI